MSLKTHVWCLNSMLPCWWATSPIHHQEVSQTLMDQDTCLSPQQTWCRIPATNHRCQNWVNIHVPIPLINAFLSAVVSRATVLPLDSWAVCSGSRSCKVSLVAGCLTEISSDKGAPARSIFPTGWPLPVVPDRMRSVVSHHRVSCDRFEIGSHSRNPGKRHGRGL